MLVANTLPYAESVVPPDWLRLLCSLAAPLFIFLSGYSVHLSKLRVGWAAYIPAMSVLFAAVFVDVFAWRIVPLLEFDVLYLISAGLFINTALRNSPRATAALTVILLVLAPFTASHFHYRFDMDELSLFSSSETLSNWISMQPIHRLLFDGWFPLLPWLSIALMGSAFAHYKERILSNRKSILTLGVIGFIALAALQLNNSLPAMRDGYVEIFYPLEYTYMLFSICWIAGLSLWLIPQSEFPLSDKISVLGRKSQLVYITHAFYLGWLIEGMYQPNTITELSCTIALLLAVVLVVSSLSEKPRILSITSRLPLLLKRVLGL
jgi:hypothetical protein